MFASPIVAVLYLVVLGLVAFQYQRIQSMEERMFGRPLNRALGHTLVSMALGLLGGLFASILLVMVGVTVSDSGVGYLLPISCSCSCGVPGSYASPTPAGSCL
jgi:hypothetical protein